TSCGMNHKLGSDGRCAFSRLRLHAEFTPHAFDRGHRIVRAHVYADSLEFFHQPSHEVGIEMRQHSRRALKHRDMDASTRGYVRESRRNIPATDHYNAIG